MRKSFLWLLFFLTLLLPTGILANRIVTENNGGKMPVLCKTHTMTARINYSKRHVAMTELTRFPLLADIIYLAYKDDDNYLVLSIGDICIVCGLLSAFISIPTLVVSFRKIL